MSITKQVPAIDHGTPWTCTDPDNFQYGRQVSPGVFQFKEFNRIDYEVVAEEGSEFPTREAYIDHHFENDVLWAEDTIILANFTDEEMRGHISAYYNSLEQLKEIYGDDWEWIVAECIFEQQSGLY